MTFTEQKLQEFAEKFPYYIEMEAECSENGAYQYAGIKDELKSFLSTALSDHAEYLIKRIEELGERLLDRCGDDCLLKMKKEAIKIIRDDKS